MALVLCVLRVCVGVCVAGVFCVYCVYILDLGLNNELKFVGECPFCSEEFCESERSENT